jgi:hypothetical protein
MQLFRKQFLVTNRHPILFTVTASITCWLLVCLRTGTASPFAIAPHFDAEVDHTLRKCNLRHPPQACTDALDLPEAHPLAEILAETLRHQAGALERRHGPFESFDAGPSCRVGDRAQLTGKARYYLDEIDVTADLSRTDGHWHLTRLAPGRSRLTCD